MDVARRRQSSANPMKVKVPHQPGTFGDIGAESSRQGRMPLLEKAIWTVPNPGAPPPLSREAGAVGLAFLDMALRQNHIRRLTERLSFVEHGVATRTTEVDVRLSLLDANQREASQLFQRLSSRSARSPQEEEVATPAIWVPVTRISRLSVTPIDVVDADGNKLPRLTQYETSRLLASGLYLLLEGILSSQSESPIIYEEEQSRWLIHAALIALLTERSRPLSPRRMNGVDPTAPDVPRARDCRSRAVAILREYDLEAYANLFDVAANDYLLVAALDLSKDDHLLSYDAPVHARKRQPRAWIRGGWARSISARYRVQYLARIPANLRSYHVVAETEPGVHIEVMSLVTNVDEAAVKDLAADLRTLAARRRDLAAPGPVAASDVRSLELEVHGALGRLSELVRARYWDANQAGLDLPHSSLRASQRLAGLYLSVEGPMGHQRPHSDLEQDVTPEDLEEAAVEIESQKAGQDFSLENDPASSRAHAYWRRSSQGPSPGQHTSVRCTLTLRDATGARPNSVIAYAIAVASTIFITSAFLAGNPWPFREPFNSAANADAVVAVLLLVPGFLYTRLDLPLTHTILGHLRGLSRQLARVSIGSAILASAAIAGDVQTRYMGSILCIATSLPLIAAAVLSLRKAKQEDVAPARLSAPEWLSTSSVTEAAMDAVFLSSGSQHD